MAAKLDPILGSDPIPWLLDSGEPAAVWATLSGVLEQPGDDPRTRDAHALAASDLDVLDLARSLPSWGEIEDFSGHHSPKFLPNMLDLLADLGMGPGDEPRVEAILDDMLAHQDDEGRFQSFGRLRGAKEPMWASLLCDTHAITDVLCRFGRCGDPRVKQSLARMAEDIAETTQGPAWRCVPERRTLLRGPGRKADVCPIVTLEGLRAFSHLDPGERPPELTDIARTALEVWRRRTEERPYMFGHGYQFKSVKWPAFWYDVLFVVETLGRFPELWRAPDARGEDIRALSELAACLIAYNIDDAGRVTPKRAYRGFERFSFGQKKEPSPFATARVLTALVRVSDLADEIGRVDVEALPSSRGGTGTAVPPRERRRRPEPACEGPPRSERTISAATAVRRVVERHHLIPGPGARNPASVTADFVGLRVRSGAAPYLSLLARLPGFARPDLDQTLYERRSLVRFRAMRGHAFIVRPSSLQVIFCATSPEILRYSRHNLEVRGVTPREYERLSARILELTAERSLSTRQIREALDTHADVGAVVTLMCDEGRLLRDRPSGSWRDLRMTYVPLEKVLPEVTLGGLTRLDASVELVRSYIRGFGPVTHRDIVWWTGVGAKRVDPALELLGDEIVTLSVGGDEEEYLMHAADVDELELVHGRERHSVALLPCLDPYTMGYAARDRYISDEHRLFVMDRAANTAPVVLLDGVVAGVWDLHDGECASILIHLFAETGDEVRSEIVQQAERVGAFWADEPFEIAFVPEMKPLPKRGVGAFMRPLSDPPG